MPALALALFILMFPGFAILIAKFTERLLPK